MKISELLDSPEKWNKGNLARGPNNEYISDPDLLDQATCFCLVGAGVKCGYFEFGKSRTDNEKKLAEIIIKRFPHRMRNCSFRITSQFNDHPDTTFKDIQLVLQEAGL